MPVKTGLERADYVLGGGTRGEGNEQHIARECAKPELACEFEASHAGHGKVDNNGEKLKRDMYCTVTVTAGTVSNAIAIPDAAVLRDDENMPFVYVVTNNTQFGRRAIDIGESQNGRTQIVKGLSVGDKVVANGSLFLQFANSLQH